MAQVSERLPLRDFSRPEWASTYASRHRDTYRHIVDTVRNTVEPGGAVLDFGAGMCDKTVLTQLAGYRCTAVDDFGNPLHGERGFADQVREFARSFGVEVVTANGALPFPPQSFDMVMMHDVIEHLHDSPRELLNDLVSLLRPGGFLFITVPSAVNLRKRIDVLLGRTNMPRYDTYYWYPGPWRGHVREYTSGDLKALAHYLGLTAVRIHGCHHMLSVLPPAARPLYRAVTAILQGCRDSWCLLARKPEGWEATREVPPQILDRILRHLNR